MDHLSTELDENIIGRFNKAALDALSKTSNTRNLAEARLYRDLNFSIHEYVSITYLLSTIVDRPFLARYIKSFTITNTEHEESTCDFTTVWFKECWDRIAKVKDVIGQITNDQSRDLALRWLRRVLADCPIVDGQLAVILSLAHNIKRVELVRTSNDSLPVTHEVLGLCWRDDVSITEASQKAEETAEERVDNYIESYPFHKLKSFCLGRDDGGQLSAPVIPSLRYLGLNQSQARHIKPALYFPYSNKVVPNNPRTLEIAGVNLCMPDFEKMISTAELPGLEKLLVRHVGWNWENGPWKTYDFSRMSNAITTGLPGLQRLEWSRNNYVRGRDELRPFGSFKGLSSLTHLTVDYQLITSIHDPSPHERPMHLLQPQEFLPPNLEVLRLTDIRESNLADLCRKYAQDSKQGSAKDFILGTATALRLRRFELCVRMEYWVNQEKRVIELAEATREFMSVMTEALKSLGTRMRVWRQRGKFQSKLLYEPGFAAPEPHWEDVDESFWGKAILLRLRSWMKMRTSETGRG